MNIGKLGFSLEYLHNRLTLNISSNYKKGSCRALIFVDRYPSTRSISLRGQFETWIKGEEEGEGPPSGFQRVETHFGMK